MVLSSRPFPWPDKPRPSPLGDLPDERALDAFSGDFFSGTWVTSFSGFMLFDPRPVQGATESDADFRNRLDELPPLIGGYGFSSQPQPDGSYNLREGYFLVAMLQRLIFDGMGGITGVMDVVRGGSVPSPTAPDGQRGHLRAKLNGSYILLPDPDLPGVPMGSIVLRHTNLGRKEVEWTYAFAVSNINALEWMMTTGNDRPIIARGTLSRVH